MKFKAIPDLRAEHTDITFEHCHILLVRVAQAITMMEGADDFEFLADEIEVETLYRFYNLTFEKEPFNRLFQTEFGKGVLIGTFVQELKERGLSMEPTDG